MGEIPQITPHGITAVAAASSRLVTIAGQVYLAATVAALDGSSTPIVLLRSRQLARR